MEQQSWAGAVRDLWHTAVRHKFASGLIAVCVAASAYGVAGLPQTFFLDAKHRIVDRVFGAVTLADINHGIALATRAAGS